MRVFKRLGKKGQTGQSLVILAIGFLALLGFVGIVTDVSVPRRQLPPRDRCGG